MNRRLSMLLAGGCALSQAVLLFGYHPLQRRLSGVEVPAVPEPEIRLLGLDVGSFLVKDLGRAGGWVPQLVFLLLAALATYPVLRNTKGLKPRLGTVLVLVGALLLAAGGAELVFKAMDTDGRPHGLAYTDWLLGIQLKNPSAAPAQFALVAVWLPVITWTEVWLLRRWPPVRQLLGTAPPEEGEEPAHMLPTMRERRDAVVAGLIPVVMLALAGGQVLRHLNVRSQTHPSITFDPELWFPYRPPALIEDWSGVLYPALRMRPLATENTGGWLATLAACLVLLAVLAAGLRAVSRRASRERPLRTLMECWYATLLAATAAALMENSLLRHWIPRSGPDDFAHAFGASVAEAVRFGTVWGWATGVAFLGAALMLTRRRSRTQPSADERSLSHAE